MTNLNPTPFIALALLAYPHPADAKSADNPDEIIVSAMRSPRQAARATVSARRAVRPAISGSGRSGSRTMLRMVYCPSRSSRAGTCTWSDL